MKCRNYGCKNEAKDGWPCCSISCGASDKSNVQLAESFLAKDLLPYGESLIMAWPPEKFKYYIDRIKKN